ncbi:vesicle transport protein SEC20-like [Tubulanus polymorphus]|uniref:vesicle transport protein SEC20-like n=1 Tax=Tubulanus polymorphus TaxID=672921 RepID=UPI003DA5E2E2
MAAEDVQVKLCIQELVKLDLQLKAVIQDIRDCPGPTDQLNKLNDNARERMQALRNRIIELEYMGKEQERETEKIAILKNAENYKKQLSSMQVSLRKANLTAQLTIDKQEKNELITLSDGARNRQKSNKEGLAKRANDITENLMSLSRTMSSQVKRSENTMGTLLTSSRQITDTHEEFKGMGGHVTQSRKLLTKYNRREFTDKLLIFLALVFFFSTVLYIMKKRLWPS